MCEHNLILAISSVVESQINNTLATLCSEKKACLYFLLDGDECPPSTILQNVYYINIQNKDLILRHHVQEFSCALDSPNEFINGLRTSLHVHDVGCLCLINILNRYNDTKPLMKFLHSVCASYSCPLLLGVPNISYKEVCYQLLSGNSIDSFWWNNHLYTDSLLCNLMTSSAFACSTSLDIHFPTEKYTDFGLESNAFSAKGSMLHQHIDYFKRQADPFADIPYFLRIFSLDQSINNDQNSSDSFQDRPFLSIAMRTQGLRPDALREALLCISAQDSQNFELLLIGHNPSEESLSIIQNIIDELSPTLKEKLKFFKLNGGGRSRPLNFALDHAQGKYISFFDDDDLLMADWVRRFEEGAQETPGALLHSYAVRQDWSYIKFRGSDALQAKDKPLATYCCDFDWARQFSMNQCPFMTIAFPLDILKQFHIRFDETLNTTEDWDCIMRTATICGVKDLPYVTAIYRIWNNRVTSQTLYSKSEWSSNEDKIKNKFNNIPLMLPQGYFVQNNKSLHSPSLILQKSSDLGAQLRFNAKSQIATNNNVQKYLYSLDPTIEWSEHCSILLSNTGHYILHEPKITITYESGECVQYTISQIKSSGTRHKNSILFLFDTPLLSFSFDMKKGRPVELVLEYVQTFGLTYLSVAPFSINLLPVLLRMTAGRVKRFFIRAMGKLKFVQFNPIIYVYKNSPSLEPSLLSPQSVSVEGAHCKASFSLYDFSDILSLRFDPVDHGNVKISDLKIYLHKSSDADKDISLSIFKTNGLSTSNHCYFLFPDPQIYLQPISTDNYQELYVEYTAVPLPRRMIFPCIVQRINKKLCTLIHSRN